ncbi:MAG TPA: FtsQ-type POTRA domain-containing protein, partial [Chitinophagaceae bacterium]|nr:FtsQ-type POTRA domain-containing protein [Chitinophagaceae bacterium]
MSVINKYTFKKILVVMIWLMMGAGTVVLLIAAISKRNNESCANVEINITGVQNNFFIDKSEVLKILESSNGGTLKQKPVHQIDIAAMESRLNKIPWISHAELYFDNNDVLRVSIKEREPVARIFTVSGQSFYIDSSLTRLPLSDRFSPRLPVFTGFPSDAIVLSGQDSGLIMGIRTLGEFLANNSFWMAQVDQVDITANREFDLVPKLGNSIIHFGDAGNYQQKFNNLLCFYKQVLTKIGWDHYAAIDAQFKGQIVGVRKDAGEIKADAVQSEQIMKSMIEDAQKQADDSTKVQLGQGDDDNDDMHASPEEES